MKAQELIIWDWNGTLLNDIQACIASINSMLEKRNMGQVKTDHYKKIFTFPVQKYYEKIGFDFSHESFENLSVEYISLYKQKSVCSELQKGAIEALEYFKERKYKQIILSASEKSVLEKQVKQYKISQYFDEIIGLDNIHAKSKKNRAIDFLKNNNTFKKIMLIGDTYHDYEVAEALGCKCLLVENGHQDVKRFNLNGNVSVINNLTMIKEVVWIE